MSFKDAYLTAIESFSPSNCFEFSLLLYGLTTFCQFYVYSATMTSFSADATTVTTTEAVNMTSCRGAAIPTMHDYLLGLRTPYIVTCIVLGIAMLVILCVFIEEVIQLNHPSVKHNRQRRKKAKWLLAVYPVMAVTSFVSLMIPRSAGLNELISSVYVSVCVYIFVEMLIDLYDGPDAMMKRLSDTRLHFNTPPLCCCLPCLPAVKLTKGKLFVLQTMTIQFALLRPFIAYILAVLWANSLTQSGQLATSYSSVMNSYLSYASVVIALIAMWSFAMVFRMSRIPLREFHITPKFFCLQAVLIMNSIQPNIIKFTAEFGAMKCDPGPPPLPAGSVARRWNSMIIIGEALLLSIGARIAYFMREQVADNKEDDVEQLEVNCSCSAAVVSDTGLVDNQQKPSHCQQPSTRPIAVDFNTDHRMMIDERTDESMYGKVVAAAGEGYDNKANDYHQFS